MPGPDERNLDLPLSHLPAEVKAQRSGTFGAVAAHYERYRPGPPVDAVDWMLPSRVARVVDLGAGTGALTRLLIGRADEVVAVEPDERMRTVLVDEVGGVVAVDGRGEAIPVPDRSADAVVASSSWHWMDPVATLSEVARVLVPGGVLGVLWTGPDPDGPFMSQAMALAGGRLDPGRQAAPGGPDARVSTEFTDLILGDALRPTSRLEIPDGSPFDEPEYRAFTWDIALDADDLIGLLGTLSWIITMPDETRSALFDEARRLLKDLLGIEGDVTADVAFRSEVWRSRSRAGH